MRCLQVLDSFLLLLILAVAQEATGKENDEKAARQTTTFINHTTMPDCNDRGGSRLKCEFAQTINSDAMQISFRTFLECQLEGYDLRNGRDCSCAIATDHNQWCNCQLCTTGQALVSVDCSNLPTSFDDEGLLGYCARFDCGGQCNGTCDCQHHQDTDECSDVCGHTTAAWISVSPPSPSVPGNNFSSPSSSWSRTELILGSSLGAILFLLAIFAILSSVQFRQAFSMRMNDPGEGETTGQGEELAPPFAMAIPMAPHQHQGSIPMVQAYPAGSGSDHVDEASMIDQLQSQVDRLEHELQRLRRQQ